MLSCLSLTERPEHSPASRDIFSKWRDLVFSEPCYRINVNPREFRYAGRDRPPVKETWKPCVHHHARRPVLFVTGRDRDNSWCDCILGWTAFTTGLKNRARHFCEVLSHGDVTLKRPTVSSHFTYILLDPEF